MTRGITHMRAFTLALESMDKPPFSIGKIAPTPKLVDQFFNDSTGEGEARSMLAAPGMRASLPNRRASICILRSIRRPRSVMWPNKLANSRRASLQGSRKR
jgi:hypothetical protein